jgi:hypothetical protein
MEEKFIKQSEAMYFKSSTKVLKGNLTLTDKRITYAGIHERLKVNHGVLGNVVRDKLEKKMGYDNPQEELIFDIPISEAVPSLRKYGFSKRLIITDKEGTEFKLTLYTKAERAEWPVAINEAKK